MSEIVVIGDIAVDSENSHGIAFSVEWVSSRKITSKAAQGDDDATATDGGREPRKIKIKFRWDDYDDDAQARMDDIIRATDPSKRSPGNPPTFAHEKNGRSISELKNTRAVIVKEAKGPDTDDAGVTTYELDCESWTRVKSGTGKTAKDPKDGKSWAGGSSGSGTVHFGADGKAQAGPAPPAPGAPAPTVKP